MPRASAADAAETARRILDAATALFAAGGASAVSLDEVARSAGVTRGALYHHFTDRAGLFLAVATRLQDDVSAAVVTAAERAGEDPSEQLRAGSHAFLDAITAGPTARVLLVEAPAAIGWTRWRELDAAASGAHLREALHALDTLPPAQVDAMTSLLSGAMNEAALWLAERPGNASARREAHGALDTLLDAVTAPR